MSDLGWRDVAAWRAARHGLQTRAEAGEAIATVARIGGLHAQLTSSAELSLCARVEGAERADAGRALWEERSLVKTWAMRGTLHLLPAAEYPTWQAALSTYRHFLKPAWSRAFGLAPAEVEELVESIGEALAGEPLTREELTAAVAGGDPGLADRLSDGFGALLKPAAFRGKLVFAPSRGRNVRFTRPDLWLGPWEPEDGEAALRVVASRYLGAYGPATREEFGRWWAISPAQAGKVLRDVGVEVGRAGAAAWARPEDVPALEAAAPVGAVRLLPAFDPFVIAATRHVEELLPDGVERGEIFRPQGWLTPVICVDGFFAGTWALEGGRVALRPFAPLPAETSARLAEEVARVEAFVA